MVTGPPETDEGGPAPRRLRVTVVTPVYPPSVGGAEAVHFQVAQALSQVADVTVLTADLNARGSGPAPPSDPPLAAGTGPNVRYLPSYRIFGERCIRPRWLWRALREARPDVLWTNAPSLTGDLGSVFGRLHGVPWLAVYHGDLRADRPYARPYGRFETRWLRAADGVFVYTDTYARRLVSRGLRSERLHVVPPGPMVEPALEPVSRAPRESSGPDPDHPFLFVGGLDSPRSYKRPELFLRALALLLARGVAAPAWIVGEGDRRPALEEEATRLGLNASVRFRGRLSDLELAECYASAWALVLPSTSTEGFGIVILEALRAGCPAVVSPAMPSAELFESMGCARVFRPESVEGLAAALTVLASGSERTRLAQAAAEASSRFGWSVSLPRFVGPILAAAHRHRGARRSGGAEG